MKKWQKSWAFLLIFLSTCVFSPGAHAYISLADMPEPDFVEIWNLLHDIIYGEANNFLTEDQENSCNPFLD